MALYIPSHFQWFSFPAIILPFLLLLLLMQRSKTGRALKFPPGPFHLPILGHLLHINLSLPHQSLWLLSTKHGPLMHLQLGVKPTVVVSSARMAREVLKSHDHAFSHRPSLISNRTLSYNFMDVAVSPDNSDYWKDMRKILVRGLLSAKTVRSFRSIREEEVARMITSIHRSSSSPLQPVNLKEMLITLTNNIACITAFGKSYEGGSENEKAKMRGVLAEGAYLLNHLFIADFLPWMWWIDAGGGLYAKLRKSFLELDDLYEQIIKDHLDPKKPTPEREDFVDVFLRLQKDSRLTRDHLKGVMMNILFGGTDTSATVVAWGIVELLRSPRAMKKCQEEVRRIVGRKGKVEEDDLNRLQYIKSVIKETMRLHPPLTMLLPHESTQHCKIDGYDILPGTIVIINAWAIGKDPESWENPDDFLPERFMNSSIDYKGKDFELIPFGAGRRGCPGLHFAAPTMELALATLLYCFDWKMPAGMSKEDIDMTEAPGITVFPKSNLSLVPTKYDYAFMD
ncbi:cytochrome P450 71A1-like [Magnolia sinica]|uniref:cytochrome P450 71A1-like n=1 Tax=Magnolia sinica TaxID=86752 RepID=UPI0026593C6D|nr:cytochrome P450 71A1-like [Magnolia sinica]